MIGELTSAQKDRRNKILESASKHFAKVGFHNSEMDKIAQDASVGKGTLYRYFKNKDDLFLKCVEVKYEELFSYINESTSKQIEINDFIKEYINAAINYFNNNKEEIDLLVRSNALLIKSVIELSDSIKAKYYKIFKKKLKNIKNKKLNVHVLLLSLDASITAIMFRTIKKKLFSPKEVKETLQHLYIFGID